MINGIGVLGWGVGGIEAEAGDARPTDVIDAQAAVVRGRTHAHRQAAGGRDRHRSRPDLNADAQGKHGVVGKFVEFFGPGLEAACRMADRATIAKHGPRVRCDTATIVPDRWRHVEATCACPAAAKSRSRWSRPMPGRRALWRVDMAKADPQFSATCSNWTWPRSNPALAGPKRSAGSRAAGKASTVVQAYQESAFKQRPEVSASASQNSRFERHESDLQASAEGWPEALRKSLEGRRGD